MREDTPLIEVLKELWIEFYRNRTSTSASSSADPVGILAKIDEIGDNKYAIPSHSISVDHRTVTG